MNIYNSIINLSKSIKYQNLFVASKEMSGIRLFRNIYDFSRIQEIFISYLYTFDSIHRDITVENISEHVLDNEIYWNSYMLWKRKTRKKEEQKDNKKNVHLVAGKNIKFPKRV